MKRFGSWIVCVALALASFGCDSDKDSGPAPTENKVNATVSGGTSATVQGTQATPSANVFGAGIAGTLLNLWMISSDGSVITVVIETANSPLPGQVQLGTPAQSDSWINMTLANPPGVFNTAAGSGTITINECPKAVNDVVTGTFNDITVKNEVGGADSQLSGSFNLVVATVAGALNCQGGQPQPDTGGDTPATPTCDLSTCDGPCCPYVTCVNNCYLNCFMSPACMGMDPTACANCAWDCWDGCNVSAECKTAIEAVETCGNQNGCNPADEDQSCIETHCCAEMDAAL